ncbi:MAG: ribosome maturation factor RimM [Lachnoclostridium sp.]|nr:ribosome maturation factor RimM [Lachnoclostridium sp.]
MEVIMEQRLRVGVITNTHGLHGEVKVYPTTDDKERFLKLETVFIISKTGDIPVCIEKCRFFKNLIILKFKEFHTIEEVNPYVKCDLMIDRKDAVPLNKDEYFICDIIGAEIWEEGDTALAKGKKIGTLIEVLQTGANDVYIVHTTDGKEILLPVIPECIKEVDTKNKLVIVKMMEGLV